MSARPHRRLVGLAALLLLVPLLVAAAPRPRLGLANTTVSTYVVGLDEAAAPVADVAGVARDLLAPLGLSTGAVFEHALAGFTVTAPAAAAKALAADPRVAFVEANRTFRALGEVPTGVDRIQVDASPAVALGSGQRVDVDVAVIDTGVDARHPDIDVVRSVNCQSSLLLFSLLDGSGCRRGGSDDHGHGTHVAGTVGAFDNGTDVVGVAPGARIWSVKVLGSPLGIGSTSDVIKGIDWVAGHAGEIEVANMSLGGSGTSQAMNEAIAGATQKGVVVVVAAGNDSADASGFSPANSPNAITVSAISDLDGQPGATARDKCKGADDTFATYSNYGSVVDIAAPGSCIQSLKPGGGTTEMSGTSMAAPHVAGAAGLYVADRGVKPSATRWAIVRDGLLGDWSVPQASACGFTGGRSPEPLLYLTPC